LVCQRQVWAGRQVQERRILRVNGAMVGSFPYSRLRRFSGKKKNQVWPDEGDAYVKGVLQLWVSKNWEGGKETDWRRPFKEARVKHEDVFQRGNRTSPTRGFAELVDQPFRLPGGFFLPPKGAGTAWGIASYFNFPGDGSY